MREIENIARAFCQENGISVKLSNDKIVAMDEYWADDSEAPKWRQDMNIGRKIKE